jgi:VanZ family protein
MDMDSSNEPPASFSARHSLRRLLLLYSIFIVYGSFIPFYFNFDPVFLKWRLGLFLTKSLRRGLRHFSTADVICNILLFAVFGFLWVAAYRDKQEPSPARAVLRASAVGLLFGFAIELAQTSGRYRNASMLDVLCNGMGALLGAIIAQRVLRDYSGSRGTTLFRFMRERPWVILFVFLLWVPLADALFPYQISLNIWAAWAKLKQSPLIPFSRGFHEAWIELFVERLFFFAAIGFVVRRILKTCNSINAVALTWLICSALALILETAKLVVVGRTPDINHLVISSTGALLGAAIIPTLASFRIVDRYSKKILLLVAIGLIGYSELMPLDWIYSNELPAKIASIEWLPFKTYFFIDPLFAAFDLGKKLYVSIPLGFALALQTPLQHGRSRPDRATILGLVIAVLLEASQIALRSRTPSVTDALLIGFGAWLGAAACEYFHIQQSD